MRKILPLSLILLAILSCQKEPETVNVTNITLSSESISLVEGDSETLTATVSPSNATNKKVIWTSTDGSIASVDNGKVTALKPGKTTIKATSDDGGKTATCQVTVNARVYNVESVSLDRTSITLTEGDSQTLTATVYPSNATNKKVSWKSSNTSVATVSNGKVSALKAGTATITVTTEDGGKTATCQVKVNAKVYKVESVSLDKTSITLTEGSSQTLTATVSPSNATNKNVSWKSSNTSVATVSNGVVTAIKAGTATITVTTEDGGKTATCQVKVNAKVYKVESVSLDKTSITLTEGSSQTLTATVSPSNATNKNVSWKSSNTSVATVSNGVVTAIKAGTATITVTTEDGSKTATCQVTVKAKQINVTSIRIDQNSVDLKEGESILLTVTVYPSNATNKNVSWTTSNYEVASVSSEGKVTAIKSGVATITAKSVSSSSKDSIRIYVDKKDIDGNHEGTGEKEW